MSMNNVGKLSIGHNFEKSGKESTSSRKDEDLKNEDNEIDEVERLSQLTTQTKAANYKRSNFPLVRSMSGLNLETRPKSAIRTANNMTTVLHSVPSKTRKGNAMRIIDCKDLQDTSQLDESTQDTTAVSSGLQPNIIPGDSSASSATESKIKRRKKRSPVKGS